MIITDPLMDVVQREYFAGRRPDRPGARLRWVMDRPNYDRLRAACTTEMDELARARAHARVMVSEGDPRRCPVCGEGPFDPPDGLGEHVRQLADPNYREPNPRDQLFGYPIQVRADGGEPHLDDH